MTSTPDYKKRCAELESIIASAISLGEAGERGSMMRLLRTGKSTPPPSTTAVIAKG